MESFDTIYKNTMDKSAKLYLELIKKCLAGMIYEQDELIDSSLIAPSLVSNIMNKFLKRYRLRLAYVYKYDRYRRKEGHEWPGNGHTMIGLKRLDNIQFIIEAIIKNNIVGDFIEAGVWRGGAVILMRAILKAYGVKNRKVWAADSFIGLPKPESTKYPHDANSDLYKSPHLPVSLEQVKRNFQSYNLLDTQVHFLKGWFKDTLPRAKIQKLSLIRADGDMYGSTMDILTNLYPKLSCGGYVIIDDYNLPACMLAVEDFRKKYDIHDKMVTIDSYGIYWQRSK